MTCAIFKWPPQAQFLKKSKNVCAHQIENCLLDQPRPRVQIPLSLFYLTLGLDLGLGLGLVNSHCFSVFQAVSKVECGAKSDHGESHYGH